MTEQEILDLNQTLFADESDITASELRQYNQTVVGAIYPTVIRDNHTLQLFTELFPSATGIEYYVELTRIGKVVNARGWVRNYAPFAVAAGELFKFRPTVEGEPNPFLPSTVNEIDSTRPIRFVGKAIRDIDLSEVVVQIYHDSVFDEGRFSIRSVLPGVSSALSEREKFMFNFSYNID